MYYWILFFCFVCAVFFLFAPVIFISYLFLFIFWRTCLNPSRAGWVPRHCGPAPAQILCIRPGSGRPKQGRAVLTLLPGSLMPRTRQGHCTPGVTGVLWGRGYRGYWATVGTVPFLRVTAGWGTNRLGYRSTAQLPHSYCLYPSWAGDRREERGWALPKNWIFSKFFLKIQNSSVCSEQEKIKNFGIYREGEYN